MSADGGNGLQPAGVRVISILARTQGDASGLEEVLSALDELRETLSSESTAANLPIVFERWAFPCLEVLRVHCNRLSADLDVDERREDAANTSAKDVARRRLVIESALQVLSEALRKTGGSQDAETNVRVFSSLAGVLSLPRKGAYESLCSEALLALNSLCTSSVTPNSAFHRKEVVPMIGFTVSTLLSIAHEEARAGSVGSKSLRSSALGALNYLVKFVNDADTLAFFLPGIVSGLVKVFATASGIQPNLGAGPGGAGADGVEHALKCMASILSCVLSDRLYVDELDKINTGGEKATLEDTLDELVLMSKCEPEEAQNTNTTAVGVENSRKDFTVQRNSSWLRDTCDKVKTALLATFPTFLRSGRVSAKLALGEAAYNIMRHCSRTLGESVRRCLLECLLTFAGDSWSQVSEPVKNNLSILDASGLILEGDLEYIIRREFSLIADTLRSTQDEAAGHLQRLSVALELAGPCRVKEVLLVSPGSRRTLCSTILESLFIQNNNLAASTALGIRMINISPALETADSLPRQPPRLQHFQNQDLYPKFAEILRILGKAAASTSIDSSERYFVHLTQIFLSSLRESSLHGEEVAALATAGGWQRQAISNIVALNEMMYGILTDASMDREYSSKVSALIVDEFVCSDAWELDTKDPDNALLLRIVMEGLGIIGQGMGESFVRESSFLTSVLCPLLDKLGDDESEVRGTAAFVLTILAESGGYAAATQESPIGNIVTANSDYVVDMISRQIRHLDKHDRASQLFVAVLSRTGAAKTMVKLLEEPMRFALRTFSVTARDRHRIHFQNLLLVLREYCSAVLDNVHDMKTESESFTSIIRVYHPEEPGSDDELTELFIEQLGSSLPQSIDDTKADSIERARRLQTMVKTLIDVLQSICPLLESPDGGTRTLSAKICALAIESLADAESALQDEKFILKILKSYGGNDSLPFDVDSMCQDARVLPHVHDVWPHVVVSLSDWFQLSIQAEPYEACLDLIKVLAASSGGEFISKRMYSDLWPSLSKVLQHGVRHVESQRRSLELLTITDGRKAQAENNIHISTQLSERTRIIICEALICIADQENSRDALQDLVSSAVPIFAALAQDGSEAVRHAASHVLQAFTNVNGDEIWLQMYALCAKNGVSVDHVTPKWLDNGACDASLPRFSSLLPALTIASPKRSENDLKFALDCLDSLVK